MHASGAGEQEDGEAADAHHVTIRERVLGWCVLPRDVGSDAVADRLERHRAGFAFDAFRACRHGRGEQPAERDATQGGDGMERGRPRDSAG